MKTTDCEFAKEKGDDIKTAENGCRRTSHVLSSRKEKEKIERSRDDPNRSRYIMCCANPMLLRGAFWPAIPPEATAQI